MWHFVSQLVSFVTFLSVTMGTPLTGTTNGTCNLPIHAGVRVSGYDIGDSHPATSADECCDLCANNPSCKVFCFVKSRKICWLKTQAANGKPDKDCTTGATTITPPPPPPSPVLPGCTQDDDCNGCGLCEMNTSAKLDRSSDSDRGTCKCDVGWTGNHCESINFGKAYRCGNGGLCMNQSNASDFDRTYSTSFTSSWGGEAVQSDDGKFHVYAASFAKDETLSAWLYLSRVVHGVASQPQGPYVLADIALGPLNNTRAWDAVTQHNPAIQRDPVSGTYLLYYMGSTNNATASTGGGECATHPETKTLCMQRIGLATSTSPYGPWKRRPEPVLGPGPDGSWDDQFTTNPTPHVFANGSVLLIYKARSKENFNAMETGAAFAEHWSGPYKRIGNGPIAVPADCEDAGIYYSVAMQMYRIVFHCGCSYQTVWSRNGVDWNVTTPHMPWCNLSMSDNTFEVVSRRERPKWLVGAAGTPTHLFTGVFPPHDDHQGDTYTLVQEILP
eukprot:m.151947 g.151947  ORF g.151947 m.151947 type:complete len:501 (+) comp17877_c0_seq2:200-1702(+)